MAKATLKSQIVKVQDYKSQPRKVRSPKHSFNLKYRPLEIVPFLVAPVLPGETLDSGFFQSSVVSDKIANRLIGWTNETHMFYVPIRALTQGDDALIAPAVLEDLFLNPTYNMTANHVQAANSVPFYSYKGGVPWVDLLYDYIVGRWFRDEAQPLTPTWDDYHVAKIDQGNVFHSLKEESVGSDGQELPGVDEIEELDILPGFTTHYTQWEFMRDQGMTTLSYSDFLRSYGITPPKELEVEEAAGDPTLEAEKIISIRKWTNPTLAPQQGDSAHSSVVYWRIGTRLTKRMLFAEPGFIFGVKVVRPKIYLGNQKGAAAGLLGTPFAWLPAVLNNYGYSSLLEQLDSATDGILQGGDEDYWLDIKDLFLHGDQFVNHTMGATANHGVALPVASNLDKKYLTEAMMNSLFSVTDGSASYMYEDGMANFSILGRITETSPQQ